MKSAKISVFCNRFSSLTFFVANDPFKLLCSHIPRAAPGTEHRVLSLLFTVLKRHMNQSVPVLVFSSIADCNLRTRKIFPLHNDWCPSHSRKEIVKEPIHKVGEKFLWVGGGAAWNIKIILNSLGWSKVKLRLGKFPIHYLPHLKPTKLRLTESIETRVCTFFHLLHLQRKSYSGKQYISLFVNNLWNHGHFPFLPMKYSIIAFHYHLATS